MSPEQKAKRLTWFALILTMLGQGAFVLYVPAFPLLSHDLHARPDAIKFSLTIFLISSAVSQAMYGTLSDLYGRKKLLLIGLAIIFIGSCWAATAKDILNFYMSRSVQGFGAGAAMVLIRASLRDLFSGTDLARGMAFLSIGFSIGTGIFPVVGGYLTHVTSWQSVFIFLSIMTACVLLITLKYYPETVDYHDLKRTSLGKHLSSAAKQGWAVLGHYVFWMFFAGGMAAYSVSLIYSVTTPFLIQNEIGLSAKDYGLLSIIIAAPYWLGGFLNAKFVKRLSTKFMMLCGCSIIIVFGAVMLICGLVFKHLNTYQIIIPFCFAIFGQSLVWTNAMAHALHKFARFAGVANSLFSCAQLALSAVITAGLAVLPDVNLYPTAITLLCAGVLGMTLLTAALRKQ